MREVRITRHAQRRAAAARAARAGGRSGSTPAGRPPTAAIHVGNARPFVVFMLLQPLPRARGLRADARHQRHRHQRQDLRRRPRGGRALGRVRASEMTAGLHRGHRPRSASAGPTPSRWPPRRSAEIVALIEALIERGHAYESGGDVYFRVRSFDGYGKLSNRDPDDMDQGEEAGTAELKEDPLDFALWKARKEGEDTAWPSPWGDGPPGLAHRVLGDGREAARRWTSRSTAAAPTSSSPTTRTRSPRPRRRAASRSPGSGCTTGWSRSPRRRCRSRSATSSSSPRRSTATAPTAVVAYLVSGHYRQPLAFSDEALRRRRRGSSGSATSCASAPADGERRTPFVAERREAFLDALADDFNTPRALRRSSS